MTASSTAPSASNPPAAADDGSSSSKNTGIAANATPPESALAPIQPQQDEPGGDGADADAEQRPVSDRVHGPNRTCSCGGPRASHESRGCTGSPVANDQQDPELPHAQQAVVKAEEKSSNSDSTAATTTTTEASLPATPTSAELTRAGMTHRRNHGSSLHLRKMSSPATGAAAMGLSMSFDIHDRDNNDNAKRGNDDSITDYGTEELLFLDGGDTQNMPHQPLHHHRHRQHPTAANSSMMDASELTCFDDGAGGLGGASKRNRGAKDGMTTGRGDDGEPHSAHPATKTRKSRPSLLRMTCLNPKWSLRTQLMYSFGLVSAITIAVVVGVCILVTVIAGDTTNSIARASYDDLAATMQGQTVRYMAEMLSLRLIPTDVVELVYETARDRIVGYPDAPGYQQDARVPFRDAVTQQNRYPITAPPLPLEWQPPKTRVTALNYQEHIQHRLRWYQFTVSSHHNATHDDFFLSTASAAYFMQGACDPNVTTPTDAAYYPNCTDANNNVRTGGVVAPSRTNYGLYQRAADLTPVLKALYEIYLNVKDVGIAFVNNGSGSIIQFPHIKIQSASTYVSEGCEWMLTTPNPYKSINGSNDDNNNNMSYIGTPEMIQRCRPAGAVVSYREYNPLEQQWFRQQAMDPNRIHFFGPFLDDASWADQAKQQRGEGKNHRSNDSSAVAAALGKAPDDQHIHHLGDNDDDNDSTPAPNLWSMIFGRAIFDRVTNEFIGCVKVTLVLNFVGDILSDAQVTENSEISVVRWDDVGTVIASSAWDMGTALRSVTIDQLEVGVTKDIYRELKDLVDFNTTWDSRTVRELYEARVFLHDGFLVGSYPMPPPPDTYDPTYRPQFLAIKSLSQKDVLGPVYSLDADVAGVVNDLVLLSLLLGLFGWCVVMIIVVFVSNMLTRPLFYMNEVTSEILNNYVDKKPSDGNIVCKHYEAKCSPRTEISDVVQAFHKMVNRFSGSSMAHSMKEKYTEFSNRFDMFREFQELYACRRAPEFKFYIQPHESVEEDLECDEPTLSTLAISGGQRVNFGSNIPTTDSTSVSVGGSLKHQESKQRFASSLFCWIVVLCVTPLLLTTITISAISTYRVSMEFPNLTEECQETYLDLKKFELDIHSKLRAEYVAMVVSESVQNVNFLARYTSWVLFGGVSKSDAFPEMTTGAFICKNFESPDRCPYGKDLACDCAWSNIAGDDSNSCVDYNYDTRHLQLLSYTCESQDTDENGDRNSTSFPLVDYTPATTEWWHDVSSVPGSEKGANSTGYDTTYDRLRSLSAVPVYQSLFNHDGVHGSIDAVYVAMENDGMLVGYSGCDRWRFTAHWQSTPENGAALFRPELCPIGKYGFDPRCREWYHSGRMGAVESGASLYVTPPYLYMASDLYAQSCTASLVDPRTKKHVGQALVDFSSSRVFAALGPDETPLTDEGFPILITVRSDHLGADSVVGPGFSLEEAAKPIQDLLLINSTRGIDCEKTGCEDKWGVEALVDAMHQGRNGTDEYVIHLADGTAETMYIAYSPVAVKEVRSVDASDFTRGVEILNYFVYSLALVESRESLMAPFQNTAISIRWHMCVAISLLGVAIIVAFVVVVYISSRVAMSITKPMIYLLHLITHINKLAVNDVGESTVDVQRDYGCIEVRNVSNTMEVLYKVVRDANTAFFTGNIEMAYAVLKDTLRLFKRMDNEKAIGVTSNNLGNTMLTMYRRIEATNEKRVCGFTKTEIVEKGIVHFNQAIKLGEKAYDEFYEKEGWSPNCLEFMQHLSNRYFNRAMFLLTVKDSYKDPLELEELGLRDLEIVQDMDVEIVDEGTQAGWNVRTPDKLFEVKLSRIRGHLLLLDMGYPDDWDIDLHLEEAFEIIKKEIGSPDSPLFQELSPAGRMQQIESQLMRYMMYKSDIENAAKVAIRILLEDEYTLPEAQTKAVEVLLAYVNALAGSDATNRHDLRNKLEAYKDWLEAEDAANDQRRTSTDDPMENTEMSCLFQMSVDKLQAKDGKSTRNTARMSLRESTRGDITMEIF